MLKLCVLLFAFIGALGAMEAGEEEVDFYRFRPVGGIMTPHQRTVRDYLLTLPETDRELIDKAQIKSKEIVSEAISTEFPDCVYGEIEQAIAQKELSQDLAHRLKELTDFLHKKNQEHSFDYVSFDAPANPSRLYLIMQATLYGAHHGWFDSFRNWIQLSWDATNAELINP